MTAGFLGGARPGALAGRGFVDAAVMCFGARGGDSVDGLKLNIGPKSSSTWYCTAMALARSRGTHVPASERERELVQADRHQPTLVLSVASLNLLVDAALYLPFQYSGTLGLVEVGNLSTGQRDEAIYGCAAACRSRRPVGGSASDGGGGCGRADL